MRLLTLTLLLLVVSAATVDAATVRKATAAEAPGEWRSVYEAGPGEANRLRVVVENGAVTFYDSVPVTAVAPCTQIDVGAAQCPSYSLDDADPTVHVATADGDDFVAVERSTLDPTIVDLGPGNDGAELFGDGATVRGAEGDDVLVGSPIQDRLAGGPGRDRLLGRHGPDVLDGSDGAGRERDQIDGGPGEDLVSYAASGRGVRVDLARATGDGDALTSIEGARGSPHADVIAGDRRKNELFGGSGSDVVLGRAGDDRIDAGETARDTVFAGRGADTILLGAGAVDCGGFGRDQVIGRSLEGLTAEITCSSVNLAPADDPFGGVAHVGLRATPRGVGLRWNGPAIDRMTVRLAGRRTRRQRGTRIGRQNYGPYRRPVRIVISFSGDRGSGTVRLVRAIRRPR